MLLRIYLIIAAAGILIADKFWYILRQEYSWWLTPLLIIAIFLGLIILQILTLLFMILTTDLKGKTGKGEGFFRFLVKHSLPIILAIAKVKVKTHGLEKVPNNKNVFLVCNHQCNFDPAIIINFLPQLKLSFIGKKEILTEQKFFAKAMLRLSCLFLDRDNDREGAKTIIYAIKHIKENHGSMGVFPEGHRSPDDELLPFRNGSFKVGIKSKAPIVVCVLDNTKEILKNIFRKTSVVDFRVVDVISPEEYENMTTSELSDIVREKMQNALDDIRNT